MAALIPITAKATSLQGFQIVTRDDMWTALSWLSDNGYTGAITRYTSGTGTAAWSLSFADATGTSQVAILGWWIVLENNAQARAYSDTMFHSLFTT
jgi:hypothetical protein